MNARDAWIEDEPRLWDSARNVVARARRRMLSTLMVVLPLTLVLLGIRLTRPPIYRASLYFLLTEGGSRDPTTTRLPPQAIRGYIESVALSQSRLLEIMKQYNLSPRLRERDPVMAVELAREDIDIEVSRNYFAFPMVNEPRTAEVTISYSGGDPELVRNVLHAIGDLVLNEQAAQRRDYIQSARTLFSSMLDSTREQLNRAQREIGRVLAAQRTASNLAASGSIGQTTALQIQARGLLTRVIQLEERLAKLDFITEAEGQLLGLNFKLIDEVVQVNLRRLGVGGIVGLAMFLLVVTLGVGMIVSGAFDRRVYHVADLSGFAIFGVLPSFPGIDGSSYKRMRKRPT